MTNTKTNTHQVLIILNIILGLSGGENVLQTLSRLQRFSEFTRLVRREGPHAQHLSSHLTVLAPSNDALQAYQGPTDINFILNHFDSVLLSLAVPNGTDNDVKGEGLPNLIEHLQDWRIANLSVKTFADRVQSLGEEKFPEFSQLGKFTFFLPVDSCFQDLQPSLVTEEVVRAHILPGHRLFSRPRRAGGETRRTSQYSSGLEDRLELSVVAALSYSQAGLRVESQTLVGNTRHPRGVVTADILLGDIALSNGVLHLISRPLVLMTRRLTDVVTADSPRYKTFFSHLEALALRDLLQHTRTLLVPTNQAFQALEEDTVTADMMKLHFLPELILEEEIKQHSVSAPLRAGVSRGGETGGEATLFWAEDDVLHVVSDAGGVTARIVGSELTRMGVIYSLDTLLLITPSSPVETQTSQTLLLTNQSDFSDIPTESEKEANLTFFTPTGSVLVNQKREKGLESEATLGSGGGSTSAYLVMFVILALPGQPSLSLPVRERSQPVMFDSVWSLLSLTVNTILLAVLIKYYKTILFVKRNIVLHLNISTCCLIYGLVALQNLTILIHEEFGAINLVLAIVIRYIIFWVSLMFDFSIISIFIFRQVIVLKPSWFCNLNHEMAFNGITTMFGIICGGFIFLDHHYRGDYDHLTKTEAFLTDSEFDPLKWNQLLPLCCWATKLSAAVFLISTSIFNTIYFKQHKICSFNPRFKITVSFERLNVIFGCSLLISALFQMSVLLGEVQKKSDLYSLNYNVTIAALYILSAFILTDPEARKFVKRKCYNVKEKYFLTSQNNRKINSGSRACVQQTKKQMSMTACSSAVNDVFIIDLE